MSTWIRRLVLVVFALVADSLSAGESAANWYWHENPPQDNTTRYFRIRLELPDAVESAPVFFACDDLGTIHVNGQLVKRNQHWRPVQFNLAPHLRQGKNVVSVEISNKLKPAGLIFRGEILLRDGTILPFASRDNVRSSAAGPEGWRAVDFDDSGWQKAVKLGDGAMRPWAKLVDMSPMIAGAAAPAKAAAAGRFMLDDFADISSWLGGPGEGARPGSAHPFDFSFGSVPDARRDDGWAGELRFDTVEPRGLARFGKNGVFLQKLQPRAMRFAADADGHAGEVGFVFADRFGKQFTTQGVKIAGKGWRDHRMELDADTVPDFAAIKFPVVLREILYRNDAPASGRILLDDIACESDLAEPAHQFPIHPDYEKLAYKPGEKVTLNYRIRNGRPEATEVNVALKVFDHERNVLLTRSGVAKLAPYGFARIGFDLGAFERNGAYAVELTATSGKLSHTQLGWLGVFEPNDGRINRVPMWFGIEDQEVNTAPHEANLHAEWMKTLGVDMMRGGFLGVKAEGVEGGSGGYEGFRRMWQPHADAGIMICLDYATALPDWTWGKDKRPDGEVWPLGRNPERFRRHLRAVGEFIQSMPSIRWFEWFNEPNLSRKIDTAEYMESARQLYPILKELNPRLQVGTGGLVVAPHPNAIPGFLETAYLTHADSYDIAFFHAHDGFRTYKKITDDLADLLAKGGRKRPVANTEAGYRSYQGAPRLFYEQARELVRKIAYSRAAGMEFYVWFMLQDYWDKYLNADDSFGLVTVDNQPKPSFVAYNELIRQLANTVPAEGDALDERLESYRFVGDDEEVFVAWPRREGASFSFCLRSDAPVRVVDLFGNVSQATPANGIVFIDSHPLPFYVRAAKGAVKPVGELLRIVGLPVRLPGAKAPLSLELHNPYGEEIRYVATLGNILRNGKVASGRHETLTFDHQTDVGAEPGAQSLPVALELKNTKGQTLYKGELRLRLFVALPVAERTARAIRLDSEAVLTELAFDPTTPRWSGADDLSAEIRIRREGENLLFEADVRDQDHSASATGAMNWRNDSIQLAFANRSGEHTELTVSDGPGGKPVAWRHLAPEGDAPGAVDLSPTVRRDGDVTRYRFAIPCRLLRIAPRAGEVFRMALLVNDNDHGKRLRVMEYFGGIEGSKEIELFGYCQFE